MPVVPPPDPVSSKLLLALVGAFFGWLFKAGWDEWQLRRRWRRLAPLVLRQIGGAATQCTQAFDGAALPRIAAKLNAAHGSAIDMVAAGVGTRDWIDGLVLLSDTIDALQAAETAAVAQRGEALDALRQRGAPLLSWASRMTRPRAG